MKKITIEHLARVEGAGGIIATIDGKAVTDVKLYINEGPRLVERLTLGKTPEEDINLVPRICAICSISHKYAAIRAHEKALQVKVLPKVTLLRELMHLGEMIESHSLHVYLLALPDYVGFPNAMAMAAKFGFEAKIGLEMKQFGNHIMKTVSGRFIHGENPIIGGFGKWPSQEDLIWIKNRAIQFMPFVLKTVKLFSELNYPDCPESETQFACLNPAQNQFGFVGEEIILSSGEKIDVQDYKHLTNEFLVSHSFCKRSQYKGKPYSVGALARINNLGERLPGEAGNMYRKYFNSRWKKNPLFNNAAQALELLYSFERIPEVVDLLKKLPDPEIVLSAKKDGKGTGAVEAPRGALFHYYEISKGLITRTDIITPTAQNAEDIERYCYLAAQKLLESGEEEKIKDRMDLVVRSFDPCLSCSVHMVQIKKASPEDWKLKLSALKKTKELVFIGVGTPSFSDDRIGLELASRLRKSGVKSVWLEPEIEEKKDVFWQENSGRPIIFLDALDFGQSPGKITLRPLKHLFWTSTLSHRIFPLVSSELDSHQLMNSFILGIQPGSIKEGEEISEPVFQAIKTIIEYLR